MKYVAIAVGIIFVAVIFLFGYFGFVPGISTVLGSDQVRSLGVKYSAADYMAADKKAGVEVKVIDSASSPKESLVWSGTKPVVASFSGAEISAVISKHSANWKYFPVTKAQLKINDDGSVVYSSLLHFDRLPGFAAATGMNYTVVEAVLTKFHLHPTVLPIYLTGKLTIEKGNVTLDVSKVEMGRFVIPSFYVVKNARAVNNFLTESVRLIPGLRVDSLDFAKGLMNFKGALPAVVTTAKK